MSYRISLTSDFKHSVKKLQKRFPHVKDDVKQASRSLTERPQQGSLIPQASGIRKLRIRNSDLKKGKSGGYRLLYYVEDQPDPVIYLLLLYAKSDREDVTRNELNDLLDEISKNQ